MKSLNGFSNENDRITTSDLESYTLKMSAQPHFTSEGTTTKTSYWLLFLNLEHKCEKESIERKASGFLFSSQPRSQFAAFVSDKFV